MNCFRTIRWFVFCIGVLLFSYICSGLTTLEGTTVPIPSNGTGMLFSDIFTVSSGEPAWIIRATTLLAPEWVVAIQDNFTDYNNKSIKVVFSDEDGHLHLSEVDCWRYDQENDTPITKPVLAFGHLKTPIRDIAPVRISPAHMCSLLGKIGTAVSYEWRIKGHLYESPRAKECIFMQHLEDPKKSVLDMVNQYLIKCNTSPFSTPQELYDEFLNTRKVSARIRFEDQKEVAKRIWALESIDSATFFTFNYDQKAGELLLPKGYKHELSLPFGIVLKDFPEQRARLKKKLREFSFKPKVNSSKKSEQSLFLHSMGTTSTLAGKEFFDKEFNFPVKAPPLLEGDGSANSWDLGAGIYVADDKGQQMLSGIIIGVGINWYKCIEFDEHMMNSVCVIVPGNYILERFNKLCGEEKVKGQVPSRKGGRAKKGRKGKGKRKGPVKATNVNNVPVFRDLSEEPEDVEVESSQEVSEKSIEPAERVSQDTLMETEVKTRSVATSSDTFVPRTFEQMLEGTVWSSVVTKELPFRYPYKEFYTLHFNKGNECTQDISLIRYRSVLGDHHAKGKWRIKKCGNDTRLVVNVTPPVRGLHDKPKTIKYCFDVYMNEAKDGVLEIQEREDSENFLDYINRIDQKTRTKLRLRKIVNPKRHLFAYFDPHETYERIVYEFLPEVTLECGAYRRKGVDLLYITDLVGEWCVAGTTNFPEERLLSHSGNQVIEVSKDVVIINGNRYTPSIKRIYFLEDLFVKNPATCLNLQPLRNDLYPITLAVYRADDGELMLATHTLRCCDYRTNELRTFCQSTYYKR